MSVVRQKQSQGISVIGTGVAQAVVDQVDLDLGIEVVREDAGAAFQAAAHTATSVLAILADRGVDSRHVRTAQLRLGPKMTYRDGEEKLVGYSAGQQVRAAIRGLSTLGPLLTDLATSGLEGVRIDGVTLSSSDPASAAAAAREAAMADALVQATHYAGLIGRSLGAVISVAQVPGGHQPGPLREMKMVARAAADMPIAAGDETISASIAVRYAFAD